VARGIPGPPWPCSAAPAEGFDDAGFQGSAGYIWTVYDAIRHIRDSAEWQAHVVTTDPFAIDAAAGSLPHVSWISTLTQRTCP
jgi:hypothetical protein